MRDSNCLKLQLVAAIKIIDNLSNKSFKPAIVKPQIKVQTKQGK